MQIMADKFHCLCVKDGVWISEKVLLNPSLTNHKLTEKQKDELYSLGCRFIPTIPTVHISEALPESFDRRGMHNSREYWVFEERALDELASQGWQLDNRFITTDGDGFGPMIRMLFRAIRPDGVVVNLLHG